MVNTCRTSFQDTIMVHCAGSSLAFAWFQRTRLIGRRVEGETQRLYRGHHFIRYRVAGFNVVGLGDWCYRASLNGTKPDYNCLSMPVCTVCVCSWWHILVPVGLMFFNGRSQAIYGGAFESFHLAFCFLMKCSFLKCLKPRWKVPLPNNFSTNCSPLSFSTSSPSRTGWQNCRQIRSLRSLTLLERPVWSVWVSNRSQWRATHAYCIIPSSLMNLKQMSMAIKSSLSALRNRPNCFW